MDRIYKRSRNAHRATASGGFSAVPLPWRGMKPGQGREPLESKYAFHACAFSRFASDRCIAVARIAAKSRSSAIRLPSAVYASGDGPGRASTGGS